MIARLSEVIAKLEPDESIKFTQEFAVIRFVVKKGNEEQDHKAISVMVDPECVELDECDFLAREVGKALQFIREIT